jgi:hypothetical protein
MISNYMEDRKALDPPFEAERMRALERAVFPNMEGQLENVRKIIGGDRPDDEPDKS